MGMMEESDIREEAEEEGIERDSRERAGIRGQGIAVMVEENKEQLEDTD